MAIDFKDYYAVLGVKKDSSPEEIKQAYRRLAKLHHPDLHPEKDKAGAAEKFKEINEAYEVLSHPEKKAKYDQLGSGWRPEGGAEYSPRGDGEDSAAGGFEGFSDFFGTFFGERGAPPRGGPRRGPRKGEDAEAELPVSLEESLSGGTKRISLRVPVLCPACGGSGRSGRGFCPVCGGVGESAQEKTVTAQLPKLVREGTRLRLRGQGGAPPGGGEPGDLFLTVRLLAHPSFKVAGADLETVVTVMPWDAALGGQAEVPSLEGPVRIKIPAGTHAGRRFRVAGRGLARDGGGRGDLYALARIDIPERGGGRMESLYKELREAAE